MIRPIDIRLNAAHPELPLAEATTYTGAPSSVFIRGVPKAVGNWSITAVNVAVTYPDNTTTARAAVESAEGVWVATIPGTASSGRTACGLRVLADGIDENGDAVTGYVLGVADFAVWVMGVSPAPDPGGTCYQMRYFATTPNPAKVGDVAKVDGIFKMYTGEAWEPFGDTSGFVRYDESQTLTDAQAAQARSNIKATLAARGPNHDGFSEWTIKRDGVDVTSQVQQPEWNAQDDWWKTYVLPADGKGNPAYASETDTSIEWEGSIADPETGNYAVYTATRTAIPGYQFGNDTDHILATQADMSAAQTAIAGKYAKPSGGIPKTDLASAVQTSLDKADAALPASGGTVTGNLAVTGASSTSAVFTVTPGTDGSDPVLRFGDGAGVAGVEIKSVQGHNGMSLVVHDAMANTATLDFPSASGTLALTSDLRYSFNTATVSSGTTPTVTNVADRAINTATLGSSVTAATVTLPAATANRARDFFIDLTIEATTAPTLTFIDPATNTTANVTFGADSLADIDSGYNLILFTELPNYTWLVSVKHEEAAS